MDSSEVDKIARMTIDKAGYGQYFIHSTGHGLGLDIHESPSLSPQATSSSRAFTLSAVAVKSRGYNLQANMVVTIEPGIYLPGKFGYRHEDTILINKAGYKILTTSY